MAKKKKKKKRSPGAKRPTYAKGKPVEPETKKKTPGRPSVKAGPTAGKADEKAGGAQQSWNLIRGGSLEMKVFQALVVVIAAAALLQYPLFSSASTKEYKKLQVKYEQNLKKWQDKYKTKDEQKKHEKEKPAKPVKPSAGALLLQILVGMIWTGLMSFLALNISRRTDLGTPLLDKFFLSELKSKDIRDLVVISVPVGVVLVAPLLAGAAIAHKYAGTGQWGWKDYSIWKYTLFFINTGIQNVMLFVFMAVAVFTWLFMRYRTRIKLEPHWTAVTCAMLFALIVNLIPAIRGGGSSTNGNLGAFALSPIVAVWVFGMGYLYWKKGLEYSLLAGMIGFGIYPVLASIIFK